MMHGIYKQDFESINTNGEFEFSCLLNGIYSDSLVPSGNIVENTLLNAENEVNDKI